jgi:thiol-disulfide isomerase/thioredoxin
MSLANMKMISTNPNNLNILKMGGSNQSIMQTIRGYFSNMSWFTFSALILAIILLVVIVMYFINNLLSNKAGFSANRENTPTNENSNKTANMLLFYVDWCPHCKTAKPEWEQMKEEFDGKQINGYTLVFTEYNCTNETPEIEELMNQYKIDGYPTIKLIKDNQVIEYDAKPTKSTMTQFLNTVL